MGGTPSPPAVPTAQNVSGQPNQTIANLYAQNSSNYSLANPYGTESFSQTGTDPITGAPLYGIQQQYSPVQQAIASGQQTGQVGAAGAAANLANFMPGLYGSPADLAGDSSSLTNQLENPVMANLFNTTMQYQEPQLDAQLQAQGLTPGSAAYQQAMKQLQNQQISTFAQVNAQFQPQAFNEALTQEQLPLQNMGTLLGQANPTALPMSAGMGVQQQPSNVVGATTSMEQANAQAYQQQ